jgi:soluble cytochrome b562
MDAGLSPPPLFGDQLARTCQASSLRMQEELARLAIDDFQRSDTAVLRSTLTSRRSIAALATILSVTRKAARKFAGGLERRGYVTVMSGADDARRLSGVLAPESTHYATGVIEVVTTINSEIKRYTEPGQLKAAQAVLQAVTNSDSVVADVPT